MNLRTILLAVATLVLGLSAGFFVTYQISVIPGLAPPARRRIERNVRS